MKLIKGIAIIGILIFLIVFFIYIVNQFLAVKKVEPAINNLPKIEQKLKKTTKEREDMIKKFEGEGEESGEEDAENKDE